MEYILTKKRIKSLTLRFDKNGNIKVSAPIWVTNDVIDKFVDSKREWIESRQNIIKNNIPKYINDEEVIFFDNVYKLNIVYYNKNVVEIVDNMLNVYTRYVNDTNKIEKLINTHFIKISKIYIDKIICKYKNEINRNIESIKFRNMISRWGSCNTKKATITLNTLLFRKPFICFEYVLLHEMVHLIHANHSKHFYYLLESLMPNWRNIKYILES